MANFDDKQRKLINSWHTLSEKNGDYYMAFIAEWITFNAICYNLYYEEAIMERASIDRSKSKLNKIQERLYQTANLTAEAAELIKPENSDQWNINIHFPERLFLTISKKYTEDRIFDLFVEHNSNWYEDIQSESEKIFSELKTALTKKINDSDRHYVINMARFHEYSTLKGIDELAKRRIIILCEKNELMTIKDVLYQIRCNIFHGEKIPGDINDDRIVRYSLPLLKLIVNKLIDKHKINNKRNY